MPTVETTHIGNLAIEGYAGDYVFETINTTNDFYETGLLHKWFSYLNDDKVILDIGANIGNHTLFWATNLPYDQIISFEPFPANYERLSQNILNNQLVNVIAVNLGIGDQQGLCSVDNFDETNYGATSLSLEIGTDGDIPITTIDLYCKAHTIKNIDLVKIDTEGYEVQVLAGMTSILSKYLPDLWIEVSNKTYKTVLEQLNSLGYILIDVSGFNMLFLHPTRHNALTPISLETVLGDSFYNLERTNLYYKNYNTAKIWINSRNEQLLQAQNKIDDMKISFDKSQKSLKKTRINLDKSQKSLNVVKDDLKQTEKLLKERDDQANELQWQLTYISEMYRKTDKSLRQIITQQKADNELILAKLMDCLEDYNENIEIIKQLMSQNNNLTNINDDLKSRLSNLQNDYDANIDNIKQLSSQINNLKKDNDDLNYNNAVLQDKIDRIKRHWPGRLALRLYHLYKGIFKHQK